MPAKILVVDDEPDLEHLVLQNFRHKIRANEYSFIFAQNGQEALEKVQNDDEIEMVLTDIKMPVMDGLTLLTKVNELNRDLKTVIISAYDDMGNIRTAMNNGASDFLTKPIILKDLATTIKKTLLKQKADKQALEDSRQLMAIDKELEIAERIQSSILPGKFAPFRRRKDFEIYAEMKPAREVGGDFYDFFLIDDERLGFVIGNVSGKGFPAAIFMVLSRTALRSIAMQGNPPNECLQIVNDLLCLENVSSMFVTVLYGILQTCTGELEYCSGGHSAPYLLYSNGKIASLENKAGMVLSVARGAEYSTKKIVLQPRDGIFLCTKGVNEPLQARGNVFTIQRLEEYLRKAHNFSAKEIIQRIINEFEDSSVGVSQVDDLTFLALRYLG